DGKPYGVDVVMPAKYAGAGELDPERMGEQLKEMIPQQHRDWVNQLLAEHDVPELSEEDRSEGLLGWVHEKGREQVQIALEHPIKLLANALGSPPKDVVDLAHEPGVKAATPCGRAAGPASRRACSAPSGPRRGSARTRPGHCRCRSSSCSSTTPCAGSTSST